MEGSFGSYTDKTRVLEIKPLRTLRPVFPSGNQAPPFVCAPPFGPYPPGFTPFYPFSSSQRQHTPPDLNQSQNNPPPPQTQHHHNNNNNSSEPSLVTPLRSFRSPDTTTSNGDDDVEVEPSSVKRKIPKKKRTPLPSNANFESGISEAARENGDRKLVTSVIMRFDALKRRFTQLEDAKETVSGAIKRPDLKAGSTCMSRGVRTNTKKRPGVVPGVEIGDVFFFRFEMCLVGLHSPSMAGIDYLLVKGGGEAGGEEPIATSIVSSGYYDNEEGNPDVLVYTGQGGGNADKEKQTSDQKLERGNLALEKSLVRNSPVRVIRGLKEASQSAKIYVYDGLYEIKESWVEKGKSGHNTFKYKLVRAPGQAPAFATWIAIQKWKTGLLPSREGFITSDLTSGVESIGVSLVNEVDNENGPAYFTYSNTVNSFKLTQPCVGCHCSSSCKPGNLDCHCIRQNGGDFPYCGNGILVSRKSMIHECSPSCTCSACKNKVTQMGIKVKLEVFKTVNKGWGLRSWDPIRAGSFICIYAGEARDKSKVQQQTMGDDDDYTFDTTRVYTPFKWNYELGLADEDGSEEMSEEPELPLPLVINAKKAGNVARFMNHSCFPNVFWQPVSYENNGQLCLHVAFFAMSHIPPMTELTYDYGVTRPSGTQNGNTLYGKKKCFCGSEYCRGSFG